MTHSRVKADKPDYFWLETPSIKKKRIYRMMIARFGKDVLKGFQIVEHEEAIYFYPDTSASLPV